MEVFLSMLNCQEMVIWSQYHIIHPSRRPGRRRQRIESLAQLLLEELKAVLAALSDCWWNSKSGDGKRWEEYDWTPLGWNMFEPLFHSLKAPLIIVSIRFFHTEPSSYTKFHDLTGFGRSVGFRPTTKLKVQLGCSDQLQTHLSLIRSDASTWWIRMLAAPLCAECLDYKCEHRSFILSAKSILCMSFLRHFSYRPRIFLFLTKGQQRCSSGTVAHRLPEDTVQLPGKQQGTTVEEIARLLKRIDRIWLWLALSRHGLSKYSCTIHPPVSPVEREKYGKMIIAHWILG